MKWGKKKNLTKEDGDLLDDNEPKTVKKTSTFSLSNLLSFSSSWLSKLKPTNNNNNHPKPTRRPPPPTPKPLLFSPPPLQPARTRSDVTAFAPRRLSVGDDDSDLARARARIRTHSLPRLRAHHHSLDFGSDSLLLDPARPRHARAPRHRRRKQRTADPDLRPIRTGHVPDPDPIRAGRRSFSGGRIRPKVRVCSPRLANPNPNLNPKARAKSGLESFAVVKSSSDPVRDFRESMVEMIWERGIGRPEELESLLACYLSLNSDEHHDVIVKVFRQVWFDLNREMDRVRLMVL